MRHTLFLALALVLSRQVAADEGPFRFDATLRIDLNHGGDSKGETFDIDELRVEGPWPGSREQLVDGGNLGCSRAEIYPADPQARQPIFSHTYCTLFEEWQLTDDAKKTRRTLVETVRLPMPRSKVRLLIKTRDRKSRWHDRFRANIDPASLQISTERRRGGLKVHSLHRGGPVERCLDIVFLGDGYQGWQMDKFFQDVLRFSRVLMRTQPFASLKDKINTWAVESPSRESGVDEPRKGIYRDTALSMTFNALGSSRYLMTFDQKAVRDIAANAPYDAIVIVSNTSRYGGGGVYHSYASFVSDNEYDEYTLVHEFGHSLTALGDEYYTSSVVYNDVYPKGVEPWEPNITRETRRARLKWRDLVLPNSPVPTPEKPQYGNAVGLFEGAGYAAKGLYRPAIDCKMFDKGHKPFCPVCSRTVTQAVLRHVR